MKLRDLDAEFIRDAHNGGGFYRQPDLKDADGVMFLCPACFKINNGPIGTHSVICWFRGRVPDDRSPGPGRWDVSGTSLDDLTLQPSVQLLGGGCQWHGFVTRGDAA